MRNVLTVLLALVVVSFISVLLAQAADTSFAKIERGHHLVDAGDCVACHTDVNGQPFAGGRPIETPFGTIYSPNITPDRETGIGAWSDEDFYKRAARRRAAGPANGFIRRFPIRISPN